jgi:hypothetical protein
MISVLIAHPAPSEMTVNLGLNGWKVLMFLASAPFGD